MLSVQHSPAKAIPEFPQEREQGSKGPSSVLRENSGDVLPHDPRRGNLVDSSDVFEHELSAFIGEPLS